MVVYSTGKEPLLMLFNFRLLFRVTYRSLFNTRGAPDAYAAVRANLQNFPRAGSRPLPMPILLKNPSRQ